VARAHTPAASDRKAPAVPTALMVGHKRINAATTITASDMQKAQRAISSSALAKGHTTTWLIAPNGSVKLLQRESRQASLAAGSLAGPSASSGPLLCKQDAPFSGSVPSTFVEEESFSVPTGSSALTSDFAGNANTVDQSTILIKGLQYTSGAFFVTLDNATSAAVPVKGYYNLLYVAGPHGC
jgi:hypothetical protein